jgi:hypothetical protein
MKRVICILIIGLFTFGCKSTSKDNYRRYLEYLNDEKNNLPDEYFEKLRKSSPNFSMDSLRANTSDFYDIEICSKSIKKVFTLEEKKLFSMEITNYGTKVLYLPEWFRRDKLYMNNSTVEMTIEIYRKEKKKFVPYVQKRMSTDITIHGAINTSKRVVYETKKGKHIEYKDIWVDINKKIVDEGSYKAKIYIDLSNFGYFKVLETEAFFEVKE